jgi:hypothetical protein
MCDADKNRGLACLQLGRDELAFLGEAVLMMELPRRHSTPLEGGRFAPIRDELALEYGDEKKPICQSYRTADDQASVAADVENFLPHHEGTAPLVGKVTRACVRFAGAHIGTCT